MLLGQGNRTVQPDLTGGRVVEHDDDIPQSRHRVALLAASRGVDHHCRSFRHFDDLFFAFVKYSV
jgi:hypothetical protein